MKKIVVFASLFLAAAAVSARPGHGGSAQGAGTPNNSFGQATAADARAHTLSGKEQSAAAKAKATEKQQAHKPDKHTSSTPTTPATTPATSQ